MAAAAIHLENTKNRKISATERSILMKFGTVMRLCPSDTVSQIRISKMVAAAIKKSKNLNILSSQPIDRF